ncbi:MAG: hypothetical protein FD127_3407, partial [Acidimicrobiaceae bacterium]
MQGGRDVDVDQRLGRAPTERAAAGGEHDAGHLTAVVDR